MKLLIYNDLHLEFASFEIPSEASEQAVIVEV